MAAIACSPKAWVTLNIPTITPSPTKTPTVTPEPFTDRDCLEAIRGVFVGYRDDLSEDAYSDLKMAYDLLIMGDRAGALEMICEADKYIYPSTNTEDQYGTYAYHSAVNVCRSALEQRPQDD